MEKAMVGSAFEALDESELVIHLVDATHKNALQNNAEILKKLEGKKTVLVLNKTDIADKEKLLGQAAAFNDAYDYTATFMVSSLKGSGTKDLLDTLAKEVKEGPWLYAEDEITDMPMRMLAAEITREKIFNRLHKELPYSSFVMTENWENFDNGSIKISQVVVVERDSQKAIVLGKGGQRIKQIGQEAREELEEILGTQVHLKLFVKVEDRWAEKTENLKFLGLME